MMRVTVTVNKDTASPAAQRLRRTMQPHELATVVSRSGAACYVSNFEALSRNRENRGGPRHCGA